MATPSRGVSVVTSFDLNDVPADLTREPPISEDDLWANLEYFLRRVLPVAERANVKLSMHPDDPPISPIRGSAVSCAASTISAGWSTWCRAR